MQSVITAMSGTSFQVDGDMTFVYGDGEAQISVTDSFVGLVDTVTGIQAWKADSGKRTAVMFEHDPTTAEPVIDHVFVSPERTLTFRGGDTWGVGDPEPVFAMTMDFVDLIDLELWGRLPFEAVPSASDDPLGTTRLVAKVDADAFVAMLSPEVAAVGRDAFNDPDASQATVSIDVVVDAQLHTIRVRRMLQWTRESYPPFDVLESRASDATLSNFGISVSTTPPGLGSQLPSQADSLPL